MSPLRIQVTDAPARGFVALLEDRLYEFNAARTGIDEARELAIVVRDGRGRIAAGLYGWTWGRCCQVKTLWIDEPHRRRGLGKRLMALVEREAKKRGARQIVLDTHSFQAPDFYRRLGFEVAGSYPDYPAGHSQIFLRKRLTAPRVNARTPRGRSSRRRPRSRAARAR